MEKKKSKVVFEEHPLPDARPVYYTTPLPQPDEKSFNNAHLATLFAGIVIGILVMIVIAGTLYLNKVNEDDVATINLPIVVSPMPTKMITPSPLPLTVNTTSWKTYNDGTYLFKYPLDWIADTKYFDEYFGYQANVYNSNKTVSLRILSGTQPYGFGGDSGIEEKETSSITIEDQTYEFKEYIVKNSGAFTDFTIEKKGKQYQVLFGTGYPVNEDANKSLEDYEKEKDTILAILSTLKIQ